MGGSRPRRRGAHVPPAALPQAHPRGERRIADAPADRAHPRLGHRSSWPSGSPIRPAHRSRDFVKWSGAQQSNAAQAAGLKSGDRILEVDGKQINSSTDLGQDHRCQQGCRHGAQRGRRRGSLTLTVTPVRGHKVTTQEVVGKGSTWLIGIEIKPLVHYTSEGPFRALGTAAVLVGEVGTAEVTGIGHFFSPNGLHRYYDDVTNPSSKTATSPQKSGRLVSLVGIGPAPPCRPSTTGSRHSSSS